MGTISSALALTTGALDADQAALNVVANNVANANTPGYTVETPDWQQNVPINVDGIQVGQDRHEGRRARPDQGQVRL